MEYRSHQRPGSSTRAQFLHLGKYARQAPRGKVGVNTIDRIAAEADREPGSCPHVERPRPPRYLVGSSMKAAAAFSRDWAIQATTTCRSTKGTSYSRKLRLDQPCGLVGVVSVPPELSHVTWVRFQQRLVRWLKSHYGDRLKCVVEHLDEAQRHVHFWVVPRVGERFAAVHPGVEALERLGYRAKRLDRELAYKDAMSRLQDKFYAEVAGSFWLKRKSVEGQRVGRAEYLEWSAMRTRERALQAAKVQAEKELQAEQVRLAALKEQVEQQRRRLEALEALTAANDRQAPGVDARPVPPRTPAMAPPEASQRGTVPQLAPCSAPRAAVPSLRPVMRPTPR